MGLPLHQPKFWALRLHLHSFCLQIDNLNRLGLSREDKSAGNLSFNYLYNDLLQGLYDEAVIENVNETFRKISLQMKKISLESIEFGYIFQSLYDLS